ncbi:hypothetical protein FPANT_12435 [Fusarium pseudoanthophilum]|uniref:Uncharacterized protein n=1 Tax=Fusarium pseudoanthophilum TaxID=48495 RepID=A0A8H5KK10_9HYPO|nr:hypothetical protein FPANT_12435 [Fusarium pseudoanthophilum]
MKYKLLKTEVHKLQDGSLGNDKEAILEKLLALKVADMMLCAQFEDPYQAAYSPAFRCNSTKYLGVTFKVCDKGKLPHEPSFWLDDINNVAMDDAPSDIEVSVTSETEFLQQNDGGSDRLEELGHRWKRFSSTVIHNDVLWGDYTRQPCLAIMNAQAEAYFPRILHLYSHSTSIPSVSMGKAYNEAILEKLLTLDVADVQRLSKMPDFGSLCKRRMNLIWSSPKEGEKEYCSCIGNRTMEATQQHIIVWATFALKAVHDCQRMRDMFEDGVDSN